jgi:SET domain
VQKGYSFAKILKSFVQSVVRQKFSTYGTTYRRKIFHGQKVLAFVVWDMCVTFGSDRSLDCDDGYEITRKNKFKIVAVLIAAYLNRMRQGEPKDLPLHFNLQQIDIQKLLWSGGRCHNSALYFLVIVVALLASLLPKPAAALFLLSPSLMLSSSVFSRTGLRRVANAAQRSSNVNNVPMSSITNNEKDACIPNDSIYPIPVLDALNKCADQNIWYDRIMLQNKFTLQEKGWRVDVVWQPTEQYGIGVYANQYIPAGTILRIGYLYKNLFPFTCSEDIESFCNSYPHCSNEATDTHALEYQTRLNYVKDYLWGYSSCTDAMGYPNMEQHSDKDGRWFGMWIPGNGLNHNSSPNTIYRDVLPGGPSETGIQLLALTNIEKGEELYDDYKRHGVAPQWLREFAQDKNITLNFADCNEFVL